MKCERVYKLMPFFQDGALEPGVTREVEDHLARCARCREEFGKLDAMVHLARTSFTEREFPFSSGYYTAVREKIRRRKHERTLISWAIPAAAALFLTVSVSTSVFLFHNTGFSHLGSQAGQSSAVNNTASAHTKAVDENTAINAMYHYSDVTLDDVMDRMEESELEAALDYSER